MKIVTPLPGHLKAKAADLYWQAFKGKLGPVMKPDTKALAFITDNMGCDHALAALADEGDLLGVVGFKTSKGAFVGGELKDLQSTYGWFSGLWRGLTLSLLERDTENARFLMDGIFVAETARGQGIGTALLEAICAEAKSRGYPAVRLDVIDTNPRARALYERRGFVAEKTEKLGPLRHLFGFSASTTMIKTL